MRRIETADGELVVEYEYDALGRRVRKRANGCEARYLWDGGVLVAESQGRNSYEYVMENFFPVAQITNDGVYFYHLDEIGRPCEMTSEQGETVWEGRCEPFGRRTLNRGLVHQPFGLPGQYRDDESGLCYSVFRYYDPEDGRFITQDPLGLDGDLNLYRYVNDPIQSSDPLGLAPQPKNPPIPVQPVSNPPPHIQDAMDKYYVDHPQSSYGDVAVMEWDTPAGSKVKAFGSGEGAGHAEKAMIEFIEEQKINPNSVKYVYS